MAVKIDPVRTEEYRKSLRVLWEMIKLDGPVTGYMKGPDDADFTPVTSTRHSRWLPGLHETVVVKNLATLQEYVESSFLSGINFASGFYEEAIQNGVLADKGELLAQMEPMRKLARLAEKFAGRPLPKERLDLYKKIFQAENGKRKELHGNVSASVAWALGVVDRKRMSTRERRNHKRTRDAYVKWKQRTQGVQK